MVFCSMAPLNVLKLFKTQFSMHVPLVSHDQVQGGQLLGTNQPVYSQTVEHPLPRTWVS